MARRASGPVYVGVDPGVSGGLAFVRRGANGQCYLLAVARMPTRKVGKATVVDAALLRAWYRKHLRRYPDVREWVLEWVSAMPARGGKGTNRQGIVSTFNFGRSFGALEAVAELSCSGVAYVTPTVWKRHFGLKGGDKRASLNRVQQEFAKPPKLILADNGIAEAALIALWRIQTEEG